MIVRIKNNKYEKLERVRVLNLLCSLHKSKKKMDSFVDYYLHN